MKTAEILETWSTVNRFIETATEDEVKAALEAEVAGKQRYSIVNRLYGKFSSLRTKRERYELLAGVLK